PYCIAAALVDHQVTTNSFSDEKLKDPRIWEVINKIKGKASKEFEAMFPAKQPSRVEIKTKDGKTYEAYLEYPKGDPREPMTEDDLMTKFNALTDGLLSAERQNKMKKTIFACEKMDARAFMKELVI
ncbi:MAG: MmgE/PrpD family protein, partial [candidate division Zixibacteria bacterium]|nr:MmgE/PrpD family protein [candidate division Zixibacteria bacterium]